MRDTIRRMLRLSESLGDIGDLERLYGKDLGDTVDYDSKLKSVGYEHWERSDDKILGTKSYRLLGHRTNHFVTVWPENQQPGEHGEVTRGGGLFPAGTRYRKFRYDYREVPGRSARGAQHGRSVDRGYDFVDDLIQNHHSKPKPDIIRPGDMDVKNKRLDVRRSMWQASTPEKRIRQYKSDVWDREQAKERASHKPVDTSSMRYLEVSSALKKHGFRPSNEFGDELGHHETFWSKTLDPESHQDTLPGFTSHVAQSVGQRPRWITANSRDHNVLFNHETEEWNHTIGHPTPAPPVQDFHGQGLEDLVKHLQVHGNSRG